jgi:hypothetical protein
MSLVNEIRHAYQSDGIVQLGLLAVGFVYNRTVWPVLPEADEFQHFNEIRRRRKKILDGTVPFPTRTSEEKTGYEENLASPIREYINSGETVIEVAAGFGICSVIVAEQVGPEGEIITYEGSANRAAEAAQVVKYNNVADRAKVRHAVLQTARTEDTRSVRLEGQMRGATAVSIGDLPDADTFVIDCDGWELELLDHLDELPDKLILEHHAVLDTETTVAYDPNGVREKLVDAGYDIQFEGETPMPGMLPQFGTEETVFVAERSDG